MRHVTKTVLLLVLFSFAASSLIAQVDTVNVIFVTDTHSHLVPFGPKDANGKGTIGGIARVATIVKQLTATEKNPLFVHSGDMFVNDIMFNKFFGVPEFKILTDLGLRAMCVGNHEFDLGPDRLKSTLTEANVASTDLAMISADLDMTNDPALAAMVNPSTVIEVGDVKIGLFGLTPSMANTFSKPAPDSVTYYIDAAKQAVASLAPQCDAIIGLTHLNNWDDDSLALQVPEIDVIIGGHSHSLYYEPKIITYTEGSTPILKAGCFYRVVGHVRLAISPAGVDLLHYQLIPVDELVEEDAEVASKVDSLVALVEADPRYGAIFTDIVGESDITISHISGEGFTDAPLGNLVTDAMRNATGTDIALDVEAWMAQPLYQSQLTGSDIFQAIPYGFDIESGYGFKLVTFSLSGMLLKTALEFALEEANTDDAYNLQVSNMKIIYDSQQGLGQKITSMKVGDQEVGYFTSYSVTMTDGLAQFLYLAGLSMISPTETDMVEYNVIRDFIANNSPIHYEVEGRLQDSYAIPVETDRETQTPDKFVLMQNFPNPFNPETTIMYQLSQHSYMTLQVFNSNGQLIRTLIHGKQGAGLHSIQWDGKNQAGVDVASGVYHYQLITPNFTQTEKMVLMR